MARFLNARIKRLLSHSGQQFFVGLVVFAFAIGLTFVEDFCRTTHRPQWLIIWIEVLTVWFAIVDGIALISLTGFVLFRSMQEFVKEAKGR